MVTFAFVLAGYLCNNTNCIMFAYSFIYIDMQKCFRDIDFLLEKQCLELFFYWPSYA